MFKENTSPTLPLSRPKSPFPGLARAGLNVFAWMFCGCFPVELAVSFALAIVARMLHAEISLSRAADRLNRVAFCVTISTLVYGAILWLLTFLSVYFACLFFKSYERN